MRHIIEKSLEKKPSDEKVATDTADMTGKAGIARRESNLEIDLVEYSDIFWNFSLKLICNGFIFVFLRTIFAGIQKSCRDSYFFAWVSVLIVIASD